MFFKNLTSGRVPGPAPLILAVVSAVLLALAFPDFDMSATAWFAFVPLLFGLGIGDRPFSHGLVTGWLFGTIFFFVTCWWLTFAPITYAGFPVVPTYLLLIAVSAAAGFFAAVFGGVYGLVRSRFGPSAILAAPFIWIAAEFARFWLTGNNWNAVGYSQAFDPALIQNASIGGVYLTGFTVVLVNALIVFAATAFRNAREGRAFPKKAIVAASGLSLVTAALLVIPSVAAPGGSEPGKVVAEIVAVQPNVPMAGLDLSKWRDLRQRQAQLAEYGLKKIAASDDPKLVVLPESPMNYQYDLDPEFRDYIDGFARRNKVSVLFNSAEPDRTREDGYFNSAVLVGPGGGKVRQYDKIHLLPFGEFVPLPEFAQGLIPPMVGRFSFGKEYDLFDVGPAKAGVMICFESHFASLSSEYARRGADLIVEMTNDGYLGPTPVLRQHLANAVFRAVETRRPVYRVTNVGITASIDGRGNVRDAAKTYSEAVRQWPVRMSDGSLTFYVMAGDWFAILCCLVAAGALFLALRRRTAEKD